ncbi:STAS/SEC14 domain-containing protein [Sphingomonas lenta]|uniref:STAS/SEC14 domain-containing protein n=1 Tax=Sphingomonas lenta TaxID=1141887 RepID=A0A2A2SEE3_9SPHN|nr:STAS/SEC14 domain-containing protein [Sphingomonas lenta]PAX07565.1 STAS/SEC14 domain-containing protein [Sphingomonas lenta]
MDASFSVTADPARDLVRITLSGFLTTELTADFLRARNEAHRQLRCGPNEHATVADIRGLAIQAQDLVTRFQSVLADPAYRSRRLAIVTPSSLARLQAQRAAGNRDARFFGSLEEAEAWALEPGPATRAAA